MPKHFRPAGKKKEGNAARYITRSHAVKQLQVSLRQFRKLCILKGIFPREPKKKFKGNHHSYYHTKDISFLQHDPLIEDFRAQRAYQKKISKAKAKKNKELLRLLLERQPTYTLDRLIKERYPTFIDALRDLDDCLTMVHLFAALPAVFRLKIEVQRVHHCRRLSHEWQAYIGRKHKLRKVFVSVKGIYYQAEIDGQKITWLTPHACQQVLTEDVDFNVMLTFLEFYETLLSFINFKLYHSINVKYPPVLDPKLEALAADLYALSRCFDASSRTPAEETTENEESELRLAQLQHQLPSNEPGALMNLVEEATDVVEDDEDTRQCKELFKDMKFFLSREVPRESLLFVIPAFGGAVSWEGEGSPFNESDESITHQIVDRATQGHLYLSRQYVQPQWVYDCINALILLPTDKYMVGRILPPHLSPFVDNEAEGYIPDYAETIKKLQDAAKCEVLPLPGLGQEDLDDPQKLLAEGFINRTEAMEAAEKKKKMMAHEKRYHEELKMELQGGDSNIQISAEDKPMVDLPADGQQNSAETEIPKSMMSRKKRGLLEAIERGNEKKQARISRLQERKKKIDETQKS